MRLRLSGKLIGLFLLLGLGPLVVVAWLVNGQAGEALRADAYKKLEVVREIRRAQVAQYFVERQDDITVLAASGDVQRALVAFHQVFHDFHVAGKRIGGPEWAGLLDAELAAWLKQYKEVFGYHDLFLIGDDGDVIFTVEREADLGENLRDGPLKGSGLGLLFADAVKGVALQDFAPYAPSGNAQAAFVGAPVRRGDELLGVIALQLPTEPIDAILGGRAGLDKSEEFYLVGRLDGVSAYRSNRTIKEGRIGEPRSGPHVDKALAGESGAAIKVGSTGERELVSYAPIDIPGLNWAVFGTIATDEAFAAIIELNREIWILGLILAAAVVIVGWYFARTISVPLAGVVNVISSSSAQISATVDQQERIAAQQAASVNETNTTMDELGASARQSAEQADAAAQGAQSAMELSRDGVDRVEATLGSMSGAKARVEAIARQILLLSEQTGQIRQITDLVSGFANETKMLAMNAAVEAVRAGEHGKGFSVLAVETRKLADESKRSAGRINELVAEIQKATNATVMATEEGGKAVDEGMAIAQETARTFQGVTETIQSASEGAQQISMNVRQQSVAVRQVVEAMQTINIGAKESASGISQVKAGIRTLNDAAQTLKAMI